MNVKDRGFYRIFFKATIFVNIKERIFFIQQTKVKEKQQKKCPNKSQRSPLKISRLIFNLLFSEVINFHYFLKSYSKHFCSREYSPFTNVFKNKKRPREIYFFSVNNNEPYENKKRGNIIILVKLLAYCVSKVERWFAKLNYFHHPFSSFFLFLPLYYLEKAFIFSK